MFSLLLVVAAVIVGPAAKIAGTNKTLELNLRAIEAFERGPFVLDVSITNRGTQPLLVESIGIEGACRVTFPDRWRFEYRGRQDCWGARFVPDIVGRIKPGETYTKRYSFSSMYRSAFPAGTHEVRVSWQLWTLKQRKAAFDDDILIDVPDQLAAMPSKTFAVTIAPATPANRWALAARLEAEFASLPPAPTKDGAFDEPFLEFCDRILYAPHSELLPLYFRALDRTSLTEVLGRAAERKLAESIFAADPLQAHRLFVDRLLAPKADFHSYVAFFMWTGAREKLERLRYSFFTVFDPENWLNPELWARWSFFGHIDLLAEWALTASTQILPDAQLQRLTTAKDFNVREWVYNNFKHRLSKEWRDAHLRERAQLRKTP